MKIKNFHALAKNELRKTVLFIAEAGLEAIDTEQVISASVHLEGDMLSIRDEQFRLHPEGKLLVVGVGKCSLEAGVALERIAGEKIDGGIVVDVHEGKLKKMKVYHGTHPMPSEANVDATREIIKLLERTTDHDLVLFVISGGGSTLLCQPRNFTCVEESEVLRYLTSAGATIQEVNTLRKHLSLARGGFLAKYAFPARVVTLIFSDVPGDDREFVASGPTVKDTTTVEDAKAIVEKYRLSERCRITDANLIETPKEEKFFENNKTILLVSNHLALHAMAGKAKLLGYTPRIVTEVLRGEAREAGKMIAKEIGKTSPKTVLLYGGETTVTVRNLHGKGGRNMELALSALSHLPEGTIIASIASDGRDNSDFGGAICDTITREKARQLGLEAEAILDRNDSYEFFARTGDYLMLGDTGSNVSDVVIALNP